MAKKQFPCGHVGKGQYCHRCAQEQDQQEHLEHQKQAHAELRKQQKMAWEELFDTDPVDLRILQNRKLVEKARDIIRDLAKGGAYTDYKGKRMNHDRTVISVPVNRDFRLIYHQTEQGLELISLMGHEEYNVRKPGARN